MASRVLALVLFDCMCDTEVDKSHPPEFLTRPKLLNVTEGSAAATFTCRVQGYPPPTVSWQRSGNPLSSSERYKISRDGDRHSLEIVQPQPGDSGQYLCQVQNSAGRTIHACSLTVNPAPAQITAAPGNSSSSAGAVDFRAVLKTRQGAGQLRPQRSMDWDCLDKENQMTDFRHVLHNTRKNSLPTTTTNITTTITTATTSSLAQKTVPNGASSSSSVSSVSGSVIGKVGEVRKNLELFEKQVTSSSDRSALTSRQSASPEHRPSPIRTGLTMHDSSSSEMRSLPGRAVVKVSAVQNRRGTPVSESLQIQSTAQLSQVAPLSSKEQSRERTARDLKVAGAHTTFSKSLDCTHRRSEEQTQPAKTDFRSVLSKPQVASECSKVSKDMKPSWARPDPSREQKKNGHNKDIEQTTSGKMDFRRVLKNRQAADSGKASSLSRDSKPPVQSSQSATDFRSVLSKLKQGGNDHKPTASKPQFRVTADRPTVKKNLPSKDLSSLWSKFEMPAEESKSVQSKPAKCLTTISTTTTAATTTTRNITKSGQPDITIRDSTTISVRKDRSQDKLALKEVDNSAEDVSSGKERIHDKLDPKEVDDTAEDISSRKERNQDKLAPKEVDDTAEDISSRKERSQDKLALKKVDDSAEDIFSWKERRQKLAAKEVESTKEDVSSWTDRLAAKEVERTEDSASWRDRLAAKVERTEDAASWRDRLSAKEVERTEDASSWRERRDRLAAKVERTEDAASWRERRDRLAAKEVERTEDSASWRDRLAAKEVERTEDTASWRDRLGAKEVERTEDSASWRDRLAAKEVERTEDVASWRDRLAAKEVERTEDVASWRDRLAAKEVERTEDVASWREQTDLLTAKVGESTVEDKPPDIIISSLNSKSRFTDDLKCSDSSQLSDSAISSAFSKLSEISDLSDSSSAVSEMEALESRSRRRLDRLKKRLGGSGGSWDSEGVGEEAPFFGERLEDCCVTYGGQVALQCRVTGVPTPTISWSLKSKAIKPSRFFQLSYKENVAQLLVAEAFSEDEGEYTCTATNSAGTDFCSCYLTVEESSSRSSRSDSRVFEGAVSTPPQVNSLTPASQTVRRGQPVSFHVTFSGIPAPMVTWCRGKTLLHTDEGVTIEKDSGSSTLTIPSAVANDSGRYTVTLTNDLGCAQQSATLSVEDVPECPVGQPHVYDISRMSVSLSWCGPAYDGGSVITHYVVEVKDSQSSEWTTLTDDCKSTSYHALTLKPDTSYRFRVRAGNRLGLSEPSLPTPSVIMTDPLQTSEDYESDDELPFEPREVTFTPGRKFEDHYEYLHEVGKGKFGSVYKCQDKFTGKIWAAKVLKVREKEKDGVRQEVEVMNQLAHPKLLMLWDAFEAARTMVLVMEFVGAGELFERVIRDDFVLTERDCVHFMRQICSGVGYMHNKSILHLDLKPENILCVAENSNQIKIIDFGLARFYKPGDSLQVLFGTPEFIAPEVVNYDAISFATDMWSIGVVCYILLSGLSPFLGENDAETLANVTSGEYDFDDESFDDISDKAKDFISHLLIKRQEKRQTITECEKHTWLSEEDQRIRCKRLNTDRLRTFMARRKWQKTGNAIRALGRMASLQKLLSASTNSHNSSGSLSSVPDAQSAASFIHGVSSSPVFSPLIHHPSSIHPLSSEAIREVEEKREEASAATITTTATTDRKGEDSDKGDGKLAAETNGDCVQKSAIATDTHSSPSSWRKGKQENRVTELLTNPNGRSKLTNQDISKDVTDSVQKAPWDKLAHVTNTTNNTSNRTETDRSSLEAQGVDAPCPPCFMKKMVDCQAFPGDVVRFDVTVTGQPLPTICWLLEEEEVEEDERHSLEVGVGGHWSLIIRQVNEDDDGEYQCRAVNSQGEVVCTADLSVYSIGTV